MPCSWPENSLVSLTVREEFQQIKDLQLKSESGEHAGRILFTIQQRGLFICPICPKSKFKDLILTFPKSQNNSHTGGNCTSVIFFKIGIIF